jgi:hypothetical protein
MKDMKTFREKLESRRRDLSQERSKWLDHWRELSELILPDNGVFSFSEDKANDGKKKRSRIFDGLPQKAARDFGSGLHATTTSPARPWFRFGLQDTALMENREVLQWLKIAEDVVRYVFGKSNLYKALPSVYEELGTFGTGCMGAFDSFEKVVRFRPFTIGEYMLDQNENGVVDTFCREFWMTPRQMVEKFGEDNVSSQVRAAYRNNRHEWRQVVHLIEPNDSRMKHAGSGSKEYRSVYWEPDGNGVLAVLGFDNFPILAPRSGVIGSNVYGVGPGMTVLPDVKSLYHLKRKTLLGVDKEVDPPLVSGGDAKSEIINSMPGGISYETYGGGPGPGLRPLHEVRPNIAAAKDMIVDLREAIRAGFYNDLFLLTAMSDRREVTAREIAERHEEKILMLAPLSEAVHSDLLDPLITVSFNKCMEAEIIPPPPEELDGMDLRVEYIDVLTQAQKMVGITANEQLAGYVGNLTAVYPEARHKFNVLEAIEDYADRLGVPPKLTRTDDEVNGIIQNEQKQAQMQQQMEQMGQAAQGAKVLSEVDLDGNNALTALTGGGV